jgi:hypothetical protein
LPAPRRARRRQLTSDVRNWSLPHIAAEWAPVRRQEPAGQRHPFVTSRMRHPLLGLPSPSSLQRA